MPKPGEMIPIPEGMTLREFVEERMIDLRHPRNQPPGPFCRDCRWLDQSDKVMHAYCVRPDRKILDIVLGVEILRGNVSALADRTCTHPGACGREAVFFEPHL